MSEIGLVLAALTFILFGLSPVFLRSIIKRIEEYACMFSVHVPAAIVLLVLSFFMSSFKMPKDFTIAALIVMSLFVVAGSYLFFRALNRGKAAIVALGLSTFVLWSSVISWILFDVSSSLLNYIAIPIILIGFLLAMLKSPKYGKKKIDYFAIESFLRGDSIETSALVAVVAGCFAAFYRLGIFFTSKDIGVHRTITYTSAIILLFLLFPMLSKSFKELFPGPKRDGWKYLGLGAGSTLLAVVLIFFGLTKLRIDSFLSVAIAFPLVTLIISSILLKERYRIWQYFGFILTVVGCILILL